MIFTETNNGSTFHIAVNTKIVIILESNPTTGYSWNNDTFNATILMKIGKFYKSHCPNIKNDNGLITGCGGKEIWTFKGIKNDLQSTMGKTSYGQ